MTIDAIQKTFFAPLVFLVSLVAATVACASPWEINFDPKRGFAVRYDGIPVIRESSLYVVSPGWTTILYNQEQVRQQVEEVESAGGPGLIISGSNANFTATQRIEVLDDGRLRLLMEGLLKRDIPAQIEYPAGFFNANLLAGVPFRAETREGPVSGRVQDYPATTDQTANDLAPHFKWIEFESRIGKLRVEVDAGEERVMFFDARADPQGWALRAPIFWSGLGVPPRPITPTELIRYEMILSIDRAELFAPEETGEFSLSTTHAPAAQSRRDRPVSILPTPKSVELLSGSFRLNGNSLWSIVQPEFDPRLSSALTSLLSEYNLEAPGQVEVKPGSLVFVRIGDGDPLSAAHEADPQWLINPEGYFLHADEEGITIASSTAQGAYYGLQTLAQLLRPADHGAICHGATIVDWPSMSFRGAHWFPSASGVPFHEKITERIMARFKMNHAVIQCEAAQWESHPDIAARNSISREDLSEVVALARDHFIEPIPLVNVPGHAEWMFRNGQNLHLAEDPETPYAYCIRHPGSFEFIQEILNEAIEIFSPSYFHLGHDEITMRGRFPNPECERCRDENGTTLIVENMERLKGWLDEREIGMMIWGDMMLSADEIPDTAGFAPSVEEAKIRRAKIPDGVAITDWHYYEGAEYPSLGYFQDEGLRTIAATWHRPANIHHFAQAALNYGSWGLLQTTWAGFFPDKSVLERELHQFSAFLLAAEYTWTGRNDPPADLPFDAGTEFTRAYYGTGEEELAGRLANLAPAARTPRADGLGLGEGWGFHELPVGTHRLADVLFEIGEELVIVGGPLAPEGARKRVTLKLDERASQLVLLNAAVHGAPNGSIAARMIVRYDDGEEATLELAVGRTTAFWGQDTPTLHAPVAWHQLSPAGTPITMRVTRWTNPHPEKKIASVTFEAADPEQAWALAGLTLLD